MTLDADDRRAALVECLAQPDPEDLPPRRHRMTLAGDPEEQAIWKRDLPLVYVQHWLQDREDGGVLQRA